MVKVYQDRRPVRLPPTSGRGRGAHGWQVRAAQADRREPAPLHLPRGNRVVDRDGVTSPGAASWGFARTSTYGLVCQPNLRRNTSWKRLIAVGRRGAAVIVLDNLTGNVDSDALCA